MTRRLSSTIPVVTIDDVEAALWRLAQRSARLSSRELTREVDRVLTVAREWALASGAQEHFLLAKRPPGNWLPTVPLDSETRKKKEEEEFLHEDEKRCKRCNEVRPMIEFHRDPSCKSGRKGTCKWCLNKTKRKKETASPEEVQAAIDAYERRRMMSKELRRNGLA